MINIVEWMKLWLGFGRQDGVFYIGGTDVLPPPLKGQEEQDALAALEQGSEARTMLLTICSGPVITMSGISLIPRVYSADIW